MIYSHILLNEIMRKYKVTNTYYIMYNELMKKILEASDLSLLFTKCYALYNK